MYTIGFSNKYYTLWDCEVSTTVDERGVKRERHFNVYIKNISFDRQKAQNQYPDAEIDENLKGKHSSFTYDKVIYPDNVFKFGRYQGMCFDEIHDYDYMVWYFKNTSYNSQLILSEILEKNGYKTITGGENCLDIMTIEEYEKMKEHLNSVNARYIELLNNINNKTPFQLFISSNPDYNGKYYDNESEFTFKFDEVKEFYYDGYTYYLPVLNDKSKRVKNKTIEIIDADMDIKNKIITIHNFSVIKK